MFVSENLTQNLKGVQFSPFFFKRKKKKTKQKTMHYVTKLTVTVHSPTKSNKGK